MCELSLGSGHVMPNLVCLRACQSPVPRHGFRGCWVCGSCTTLMVAAVHLCGPPDGAWCGLGHSYHAAVWSLVWNQRRSLPVLKHGPRSLWSLQVCWCDLGKPSLCCPPVCAIPTTQPGVVTGCINLSSQRMHQLVVAVCWWLWPAVTARGDGAW